MTERERGISDRSEMSQNSSPHLYYLYQMKRELSICSRFAENGKKAYLGNHFSSFHHSHQLCPHVGWVWYGMHWTVA